MSLWLERQLSRHSVAMLLYSKRFGRVSNIALDVLSSLLGELLFQIWRRAGMITEVQTLTSANIAMVASELLRATRCLYISIAELEEFTRELRASENGKFWEDRPVPMIKSLPRRDGNFILLEEPNDVASSDELIHLREDVLDLETEK